MVWEGHRPGIYIRWEDCKAAVNGYPQAKYKSFDTFEIAKKAFNGNYEDFKKTSPIKKNKYPTNTSLITEPNLYSIAVDAASSGNPGVMEYRGVDTQTKKQLFHQGPFAQGTNNIGEFLALVHGLAYLKKINSDRIIYSDSKIAMGWVQKKICKTTLQRNPKNNAMFELVDRALLWLRQNTYKTQILKWETKIWGEIPADFGRK